MLSGAFIQTILNRRLRARLAETPTRGIMLAARFFPKPFISIRKTHAGFCFHLPFPTECSLFSHD
jgi:hypothetical protein